ncbi:MAG: choice-of-anchor X domain-containing protein, partial [Candidatus Riflebacteria bacterium]
EVTNPVVVADFTNWQPQQMYDDATNGDEVAGDGVYTRLFTGIAPGYHKYAFNITDTSQVKDPYQESGDSEYSIILVK